MKQRSTLEENGKPWVNRQIFTHNGQIFTHNGQIFTQDSQIFTQYGQIFTHDQISLQNNQKVGKNWNNG